MGAAGGGGPARRAPGCERWGRRVPAVVCVSVAAPGGEAPAPAPRGGERTRPPAAEAGAALAVRAAGAAATATPGDVTAAGEGWGAG